ncbi:uncharacterized protein N7503_011610 [Penicillium pulvis]|uniref:uncharacterized protein n=1 Tax=Penicillium pulvis TaxID=1562058 RepID=UPI0025481213|nr:uncharacterized protein N7503_011610 [Penicillium pulvis]KAJ5786398.1 hypothetical protein N7503_011610 [Penicillium pulvis]
MAPEPVPEPKFQPLHVVLAEAFSDDSPKILCAFLESDGRPCGDTVEKTDLLGAKYYVEKVSQYLTNTTETSPLLALLFQLCNYCLCGHHMKHNGHPKSQWLRELKTKALRDEFISLMMANERWPPPPRVLEFIAIKTGKSVETWLETLKRIEEVLKKELKGIDKNYVYVLSSPEAVGKFKIGVCKDHPLEKRTDQHLKCYPSSKIIKHMAVPRYAYRVEQLMLAEFKEYHFQLEAPCHVYDHGRHKEWLNVDADILVGRIREWQDFFIDRPHKMKLYAEDGSFNRDAGPLSPPHRDSERPTDSTPMRNGHWPSSRSPTPCNDSPDPFSTINEDTGKASGNPVETPAVSTPTKPHRRSSSSRSSCLPNDNPVPSSKESGGIGKAIRKSQETNKNDTPTKNRRTSRRFLAPPDESPIRSTKKNVDTESISDQSSRLPEKSTPTKPDSRLLRLASSPKESSVSGLKVGKKSKDKSGNSTESDISENLSMIKLTSGRRTRSTSAMSQEAAVK